MEVNDKVVIANIKHKYYGYHGVITKLDRGNVWVDVFNDRLGISESICTRMSSLRPN